MTHGCYTQAFERTSLYFLFQSNHKRICGGDEIQQDNARANHVTRQRHQDPLTDIYTFLIIALFGDSSQGKCQRMTITYELLVHVRYCI